MTLITQKIQKVYTNLLRIYDLPSLSGKSYTDLLSDDLTYKFWVLLLQSQDEFFNAFKLWLRRAKEVCKKKLGYL